MSSIWSYLHAERVPESEVMDGEGADEYISASAARHLERLDETFVVHALSVGVDSGRVLDVGTGPGNIPIRMGQRNPALEIVGVDLSDDMITNAEAAARKAAVHPRVSFQKADAKRLPFEDRSFDLVLSNSTLHHVSDPLLFFNEIGRVVTPRGAVLIRDLRRPTRVGLPFHVRVFGRYYEGVVKKMFVDSLRAAYTIPEAKRLVTQSSLRNARVYKLGWSYLAVELRRSPS